MKLREMFQLNETIEFDFDVSSDTNPEFVKSLAKNNGIDIADWVEQGSGGGNAQVFALCGDANDGKKFLTYLYDKETWNEVVSDFGDYGLGREEPEGLEARQEDEENRYDNEEDVYDDTAQFGTHIPDMPNNPYKKEGIDEAAGGDFNSWLQQLMVSSHSRLSDPQTQKQFAQYVRDEGKTSFETGVDPDAFADKFFGGGVVDEATDGNFNEWFQAVIDYAMENAGMSGQALESPAFMKQAKQAFKAGDDPYSFMTEYMASRAEHTFGEAVDSGFFGGDEPAPVMPGRGTMKRSKQKKGMGWMGRNAQHVPVSPQAGKFGDYSDCELCKGYGHIMTGAQGQSNKCPQCQGTGNAGFGGNVDEAGPGRPFVKGGGLKNLVKKMSGGKGTSIIPDFEQEVWDYAQNRYGWDARKLNNMAHSISVAKDSGVSAEEFVDTMARGGMHEAHGENAEKFGRHEQDPDTIRNKASRKEPAPDFGDVPDDAGFGNKDDQFLTGNPDVPERGEFDQRGGFSAGEEGPGFEDPTSSRSNPDHGFMTDVEPSIDPEDPLWHGTDVDPEDTPSTFDSQGQQTERDPVTFPDYDDDFKGGKHSNWHEDKTDVPDEKGFHPRTGRGKLPKGRY